MPRSKFDTLSPIFAPIVTENIPESMQEINTKFRESGTILTSDTIDTTEDSNLKPIYYDGIEFGYFVNLPENGAKEYNNGLYAQNFGNANDCFSGFDPNFGKSTRLWTRQAEKTVYEIQARRPEICTLNDMAITERLVKGLGPNYYMYFTPCWNSDGWLTTYSAILIAKKDGVEPPDQVKFIGDYGKTELVEKFDGKDRFNTSSFGMSLVQLRNDLEIGVKYGNCFATPTQRIETAISQIGGLSYLKNLNPTAEFLICGDANTYGPDVDSSYGNGPKIFLKTIVNKVITLGQYDSNKEIGRINKILRGAGLQYLMERDKNNKISTTFNGVAELDIRNTTGLEKQKLVLKRFVVRNLIGLGLDNGYTNMRNLKMETLKTGFDHDGTYTTKKDSSSII